MHRNIRFFAVLFLVLFVSACHKPSADDLFVTGPSPTAPAATSPFKVRVVDVTNDTHQVFDVDVIGLFWNGMETALKKRGMLWDPAMGGNPITVEGHVLQFKKGAAPARLLPYAGDTLLSVKVEVKTPDGRVSTIESKRKIAFGSKPFTRRAWVKLFDDMSEEVINQAAKKF